MRPPVEIDGLQIAAVDARLAQSGLLTPAGALRARSGVLGAPVVCTGQATPSMVVTVPAFVAAVDADSFGGSFGGPTLLVNDAPLNVTISASSGTNPRIDLIVVKWVDETAGVGARGGFLSVVAGTPATTPVSPAMPANSFLLAKIAVGTSVTVIRTADITNPQITTTAVGGITPSRTGTDVAGAYQDQYRSVAGKLQVYRGTTWQRPTWDGEVAATQVTPAAGWSQPTGGQMPLTFSRTAEGLCSLSGAIFNTNGTAPYTPGTLAVVGTLPASVRPSGQVFAPASWTTSGTEVGYAHINVNANGTIVVIRASSNSIAASSIHGINMTWNN